MTGGREASAWVCVEGSKEDLYGVGNSLVRQVVVLLVVVIIVLYRVAQLVMEQ